MTAPSRSSHADVAVLGGGPAGLGAAFRLAGTGVRTVVLEAGDTVGGLAGSRRIAGMRVDYGSHRLHPSIAPEILADLRALPGVDLQRRARNGRILITDRWVAFPLRVGDAIRHLPPALALGLIRDTLAAPLRRPRADTFDQVLRAGVGPALAGRFYFPYARKIWGVEPSELSGELARRRVGANSVVSIVRRMVRGHQESPWFWYPSAGFGALSEGLADAAAARGADIRLRARVAALRRNGVSWTITTQDGGTLHADHVWSTLPVPVLAGMTDPAAPRDVRSAAAALRYRAMVLVYLTLDRDRFSGFDAHYLPEGWTPVTRISEPRNYRDSSDPEGVTVLCAEVPCAPDDRWWAGSDAGLAAMVADTCAAAGLDRPESCAVEVVRRRYAYPIATVATVQRLQRIEQWVASLPGVVTLGRQGLFAHDNTHHALAMAWAAADALRPDGTFDHDRWRAAREGFRAHVVED